MAAPVFASSWMMYPLAVPTTTRGPVWGVPAQKEMPRVPAVTLPEAGASPAATRASFSALVRSPVQSSAPVVALSATMVEPPFGKVHHVVDDKRRHAVSAAAGYWTEIVGPCLLQLRDVGGRDLGEGREFHAAGIVADGGPVIGALRLREGQSAHDEGGDYSPALYERHIHPPTRRTPGARAFTSHGSTRWPIRQHWL